MKPVPKERRASAKGIARIESYRGAPGLDQIQLSWAVIDNPINNPTNADMGHDRRFLPPPLKTSTKADGSFEVTGMSPMHYYLTISAEGCIPQSQIVEFSPGESRVLDPVNLDVARHMDVEYLVSADGDFSKAATDTATLTGGSIWRISGFAKIPFVFVSVSQKSGKLC